PALANDPNGDGRITLAEFRGTPVVANFYADWCTSCDAELPGFATVSAELRDRVVFVGVNSQESGDRFRQPRQFGTDWWPLARDINGRQGGGSGLFDSLGGTGMPITAFYRADGSLAFVQRGAMSETDLRAVIRTEFGVEA
ncbi:MAG: TlpA family protein disulfide reductase, partial [Actinomyces sp.]